MRASPIPGVEGAARVDGASGNWRALTAARGGRVPPLEPRRQRWRQGRQESAWGVVVMTGATT